MSSYVTLAEAKVAIARIDAVYDADADLQRVLDASEGMVNAAIASRYDIPVTESEAVDYIQALVIPILRYKTFTQFADMEEFPEGIKVEYKSTMKSLEMLAKRVTSLPNVDDKTTGRASHIKISTSESSISTY